MNRSKSIMKSNFVLGMRRDSALAENSQIFLRSIKNYKIDYIDGALVVRDGYSVWNTKPLPDVAYQLYHFVDMSNNEHLLAICSTGIYSRWYLLSETDDHEMIIDEYATSPDADGYSKPILTIANRCFFATNSEWYWADNDTLSDTTKCYPVGIERPTGVVDVEAVAAIGNYATLTPPIIGEPALCYLLNNSTQGKVAGNFTLSYDTFISSVYLYLTWGIDASKSGSIRVSIVTDNSGSPSETLAHEMAVSKWSRVALLTPVGEVEWVRFDFADSFMLEPGTYWVVVESNDSYKNNFNTANFFLAFGYNNTAGGANYALVSQTWSSSVRKLGFYFGGAGDNKIYDYVYTLVNSKYGIESRPSDKARVVFDMSLPVMRITTPSVSDAQADKVRIYRREYDASLGYNATDEYITDEFKLFGEYDITSTTVDDAANSTFLGGVLQTLDHYRITEADDTNENRRRAVIPKVATFWKGRVWVTGGLSNIVYYSKKLEEDGACGITGDMIVDYFPLDNQLEVPTAEAILRMEPLAGDQLAIYCRNGSIWLLSGCDSVLNPLPIEDFMLRQVIPTNGLVAYRGLADFRGRHIYLSRNGIYAFTGSPNLELLSENIQSIISDIDDAHITNSVLRVINDELWCLLDDDNDGSIDNIYILDLNISVPTWRYYNYNSNINDIIQRSKGLSYKTVFACIDDKDIFELENGDDDNSQPIETEVETHNLRVESRVMVHGVEATGCYPTLPPSYEVSLIDDSGEEHKYWIMPESTSDIRANRVWTRVIATDSIRLRLKSISLAKNHLKKLRIDYVEK